MSLIGKLIGLSRRDKICIDCGSTFVAFLYSLKVVILVLFCVVGVLFL